MCRVGAMLSMFFVWVFFIAICCYLCISPQRQLQTGDRMMDGQGHQHGKKGNGKFNYNYKGKDKYRSLVFLSQRFGGEAIAKRKGIEMSKNHEVEDLQMFSDVSIADKIRILRKPAYNNLPKPTLKNERSQFHLSTQMNPIGNKTAHNFIETHRQKIQIISKRKLSLSKPELNCNSPLKESKLRVKRKEKQKGDEIEKTDRSALTDAQPEAFGDVEAKGKVKERAQRCRTQMKEEKQKRDIRWASRSSLEWIGEDCGKEKQSPEMRKKSNKKTLKDKNKDFLIPKSCLYMSMYLRMREKQSASQLSNPNAKTAQPKAMNITKIRNRPQPNYFLKIKQCKSVFNNFSYYALASKYKRKKGNKEIVVMDTVQPVDDFNVDVSKERYYGLKGDDKSQSRKRYRKDSRISAGKGPTITIDPW